MSIASDIDKKQLKDLLSKNHLTHDAMWFFHCTQAFGIEQSNKINKLAVQSFATIEAKRLLKLMGKKKIETTEDINALILMAQELVVPDFMEYTNTFENPRIWNMEIHKCFAYDGVKKYGLLDHYDCGIMERIVGWFKGLSIPMKITPELGHCLMHTQGKCQYTIEFLI